MRLSSFLPLGALVLAPSLAATEFGSGDPYIDSLPFQVRKVTPKTVFATDPPMGKCTNGLLYMISDSLGLERQVMDGLIELLGGLLSMLGLGDLGGILGREATPDSTSYVSGLPPRDFKTAMEDMLERTYKDKRTGKPEYDSSPAFAGIWGMRTNIVSALKVIEALGANERFAKFMALGALAGQAKDMNGGELEQVLNALRENINQANCANVSEDETDAAGLCKLAYANDTSLDMFDGSISPRTPTVVTTLEGMGLNIDLSQLPDLITGFATSRVVYTLINYVIGQLQTNLQLIQSNLDLDFTGGNLAEGACRSAAISREFDFDPIWASCTLGTAVGAVLGCAQTSLTTNCTEASKSTTPNWEHCDRVYGPTGSFTLGQSIPLTLTPADKALDPNGNLLPAAVEKEGYNYFYLFSAALASGSFANPVHTCKLQPNPIQLVPGWDRVLDVWATQEGDPAFESGNMEHFPVASLSRQVDYVMPFTPDGDLHYPDDSGVTYTMQRIDPSRSECWQERCKFFDDGAALGIGAVQACARTVPRDCQFKVNYQIRPPVLDSNSPEWYCTPSGFSDYTIGFAIDSANYWDLQGLGLNEVIDQNIVENSTVYSIEATTKANPSTVCDFSQLYVMDGRPTDCYNFSSQGTFAPNPVVSEGNTLFANVTELFGAQVLGIGAPERNGAFSWSSCGNQLGTWATSISGEAIVTGDDFHDSDPLPKGTCNFLLTQRGTASAFEWATNFDAVMTPGYNATDGALVHKGYKKYADAIMPVIEEFIKAEYLETNECSPANTSIMITGHSLGGGLAEVYTHYITNRDTFADMKIELVTFAPAHGLSRAATESLRHHANVRSVVGEYDIIPFFPCAGNGGLMRCDPRNNAILAGGFEEGWDESYGEHINTITLTADMMSSIDKRFGDLRALSISFITAGFNIRDSKMQMPATVNVAAWHICSYACWASSHFCTTDPQFHWMCKNCVDLQNIGMGTL